MSINKKLVARLGVLLAPILLGSPSAHAETAYHRLVWDSNPSTSAVIGFSPSDSTSKPYVSYGYSTNDSQWTTQSVTNTQTFAGSLTSHFVRLTGLNADSAVYYRVCDQSGCGENFWFRTAPTDNSPYVVVAGGDTRTGMSNRRAGNALISKIRPLFIMHGGDYTNANSAYEMIQYLADWELTYSSDFIDGESYKRIYPFIPAHGNHEDTNFNTLCEVFGVDYDQDNNCSSRDTYAAFNISPLLRVYTLNSQFQNSGFAAKASAMNTWLSGDLSSSGSSATWRFAQYHKPMFPHSAEKSDNPILYGWWADLFFDNAMNVVMESDTHIAKVTKALLPSGNGFAATTSGGTVYMGEGSWGAPARSANKEKSWTIDLAGIQQFKVVTVSADNLEVRTAQFLESASTLTWNQRASDATVLPSGVNWWNANNIGEVMTLGQSAQGHSIIHNDSVGGGDSSDSFNVSADTFISSTQSDTNFDGGSEQLLADGSDDTYGQMMSLIKFDLSSVSSCVAVTSATIILDVFDPSLDTYSVYESARSWSASSATWHSVDGASVKGTQLAVFNPLSTGVKRIVLDSAGVNLVEGWIQGSNTGIVIASESALDGVDVRDMESGNGAKLELVLDDSGCGLPTQLESVSISQIADTTISSTQSDTNFDGGSEQLLADGSDDTYGQMMSLIKFDLSSVSSCVDVVSATITLDVFDPSLDTYGVYESARSWSASSATWNSVGGALVKGAQLAVFNPSSTGVKSIVLDSAGVNLVEGWIQGSNTGIVIAPESAPDGVDVQDMESGNGAKLELVLDETGCELPAPTPSPLEFVSIPEIEDTTISSAQANTNLNSVLSGIEADGWDSQYDEMISLIKFSVTADIPSCAAVTGVKLQLNIDDVSSGSYQVFAATSSWTASGATWSNVGGANVKGTFMGDFTPSSLGTYAYDLDSAANAVVMDWAAGANNGMVIASDGTSDGVIITDDGSENAKLQVTYDSSNCP